MGGVATCVKNSESHNVLKVTEGKEYIITRHSEFITPINVINIYGNVESRTKVIVLMKNGKNS